MDPLVVRTLFKITPRNAAGPALPRGGSKTPESQSGAEETGLSGVIWAHLCGWRHLCQVSLPPSSTNRYVKAPNTTAKPFLAPWEAELPQASYLNLCFELASLVGNWSNPDATAVLPWGVRWDVPTTGTPGHGGGCGGSWHK